METNGCVETYENKFERTINQLKDVEKSKAIANHGNFKNDQEFIGAFFEEYEEVIKEIKIITEYKDYIWNRIMKNSLTLEDLESYSMYAKNAIKELIQTIAVIEKGFYLKKGDLKNEF